MPQSTPPPATPEGNNIQNAATTNQGQNQTQAPE